MTELVATLKTHNPSQLHAFSAELRAWTECQAALPQLLNTVVATTCLRLHQRGPYAYTYIRQSSSILLPEDPLDRQADHKIDPAFEPSECGFIMSTTAPPPDFSSFEKFNNEFSALIDNMLPKDFGASSTKNGSSSAMETADEIIERNRAKKQKERHR